MQPKTKRAESRGAEDVQNLYLSGTKTSTTFKVNFQEVLKQQLPEEVYQSFWL